MVAHSIMVWIGRDTTPTSLSAVFWKGSRSKVKKESPKPRLKMVENSGSELRHSGTKVGIGEENDRRCLHNHLLHQMEAKKSHRFVSCRKTSLDCTLVWTAHMSRVLLLRHVCGLAWKGDSKVCDFCRRKVTAGELFWSCERCVWDVCQATRSPPSVRVCVSWGKLGIV